MTKKEAYKRYRALVSQADMKEFISELGLVPMAFITPSLLREYMKELSQHLFKEVEPFVRDFSLDFLEEFVKRSRAHTKRQIERTFFDVPFYDDDENLLF